MRTRRRPWAGGRGDRHVSFYLITVYTPTFAPQRPEAQRIQCGRMAIAASNRAQFPFGRAPATSAESSSFFGAYRRAELRPDARRRAVAVLHLRRRVALTRPGRTRTAGAATTLGGSSLARPSGRATNAPALRALVATLALSRPALGPASSCASRAPQNGEDQADRATRSNERSTIARAASRRPCRTAGPAAPLRRGTVGVAALARQNTVAELLGVGESSPSSDGEVPRDFFTASTTTAAPPSRRRAGRAVTPHAPRHGVSGTGASRGGIAPPTRREG